VYLDESRRNKLLKCMLKNSTLNKKNDSQQYIKAIAVRVLT